MGVVPWCLGLGMIGSERRGECALAFPSRPPPIPSHTARTHNHPVHEKLSSFPSWELYFPRTPRFAPNLVLVVCHLHSCHSLSTPFSSRTLRLCLPALPTRLPARPPAGRPALPCVLTWCSTCILSRMVAPSFVMVTSPSGLTSILSIPLGPREDRRMLLTLLAARMFVCARVRVLGRGCLTRRGRGVRDTGGWKGKTGVWGGGIERPR